MMTNVMVKTWIEQKIIKNSNLIQAMRNSVCPTANVIRRPIFPQFPNCGFKKRHDNREVTLIEFYESRICPNIYRMFRSVFRSVDWTHDMIIVKWHLFFWHERKLCALTNAPPVRHRFNPPKRVNDYQRYSMLTSMLTVLALRSMSCTLGNSISL